jgi:hypothetical protein
MKYLTLIILVCLFTVPLFVFGQNSLVPDCGWFDCTFTKDILGPNGLINKIIGWIVTIAVPAASIAIMWAGVQMVIYSDNPSKRQAGKKMLIIALWGLVIVLGSYVAVKTITDFFVDSSVAPLNNVFNS